MKSEDVERVRLSLPSYYHDESCECGSCESTREDHAAFERLVAENAQLKAQNERLISRGFQDLHHENAQLKTRIESGEYVARLSCESCECDFWGVEDDSTCRGCGMVVCEQCVDVFRHFENEEHGSGDPLGFINDMREKLSGMRELLADDEWWDGMQAQLEDFDEDVEQIREPLRTLLGDDGDE